MSTFQELQERFMSGDNTALIDVLRASIHLNIPLPDWAKGEILGALDGWRFAEYVSLDEAFGVKRVQFRQDKEERIAKTLWQTYAEIEDLRRNKNMSLPGACGELAKIRDPDNPDHAEKERTIRRDYEHALQLLKNPR